MRARGIANVTYEVSWKDRAGKITLEVYSDIHQAIDRTSDLQLSNVECYLVFVPDLTNRRKSFMDELLEEYSQKLICDFIVKN